MAIQEDTPQPVGRIQASRRRRPSWGIAAVVVGIFALLLVADWWQSNREMGQLLTAVESSEKSMTQRQAAVDTMAQAFLSPTTDSETRQTLLTQARSACSSAAADVQDIGVVVSDVQMLPWHLYLNQAKSRYLANNAVWLRQFRECAVDPVKWRDQATGSEITATFRVAHRSFQGAVPFLPLNRAPERIAAIFKE